MVAAAEIGHEVFVIPGQIGPKARSVLLWAQQTIAAAGAYRYLEIGSFRGCTLLPHVICDECVGALSIDLRPQVTPDERGDFRGYHRVTTESMVALIKECASDVDVDAKLEALTDDSNVLKARPDLPRHNLALIDGEHTNTAVFVDALNVLRVMADDCIILFDDTSVVLDGVLNAAAMIEDRGRASRLLFTRSGISIPAVGRYAKSAKPPPRYLIDLATARADNRRVIAEAAQRGGAAEI